MVYCELRGADGRIGGQRTPDEKTARRIGVAAWTGSVTLALERIMKRLIPILTAAAVFGGAASLPAADVSLIEIKGAIGNGHRQLHHPRHRHRGKSGRRLSGHSIGHARRIAGFDEGNRAGALRPRGCRRWSMWRRRGPTPPARDVHHDGGRCRRHGPQHQHRGGAPHRNGREGRRNWTT